MNGFEIHHISHLSASQLNTWVSEPGLWIMEKLLKRSVPVGAAAHRGAAIERGIEHGLFYTDAGLEDCQSIALREFDRLSPLSESNPESVTKERVIVGPAVQVGLAELRAYGKPLVPDSGRQHKISIELDDVPIPIIGYLDFVFDECGVLIDLKTEHKLSSRIKAPHARQLAIYRSAMADYEVRCAYVTPKKPAVYLLETLDAERALNQVRQIAIRLERFLRLSRDPAELAAIVCPDPDSFYWNHPAAQRHRQEVYGY